MTINKTHFPEERFTYEGKTFHITEAIGKGSTKKAFLAIHPETDTRIVALYLRCTPSNGHIVFQNLQREVSAHEACALIPGVVKLLEPPVDIKPGCIRMLEEFCDGGSLLVWAPGKSLRQRIKILFDVAISLQEMHAKEVAHGDIKPQNIGVKNAKTENPTGVIFDLGCVVKASEPLPDNTKMTGTQIYLSPGTDSNDDPFQRDVFALGVCLYEICGKTLREAALFEDIITKLKLEKNLFSYVFRTKQKDIFDLIHRPNTFPAPIQNLLKKMLCMDPQERSEIKDVVDLLSAIMTNNSDPEFDAIGEGSTPSLLSKWSSSSSTSLQLEDSVLITPNTPLLKGSATNWDCDSQ